MCNWYKPDLISVSVRWECSIENALNITNSVRQGDHFSPKLFNAYIDGRYNILTKL